MKPTKKTTYKVLVDCQVTRISTDYKKAQAMQEEQARKNPYSVVELIRE